MLFVIFVSYQSFDMQIYFIKHKPQRNSLYFIKYKHYLTIKNLNTLLYEERKLDSNTKHCCIMP